MESYLDIRDELQILAEGAFGTKIAAGGYCIEPASGDILSTIFSAGGNLRDPFWSRCASGLATTTAPSNSTLDDMWRSRTGVSEHIWCP